MKSLKKVIAVVIIIAVLFSVQAFALEKTDNHEVYPFVMVHGMGGWGDTSAINKVAPYWGATSLQLVNYLNESGNECYAASVGPFSSAWDRTCELYAELTGTTVDYGKAHSELHGHERYGRTYDAPLFEGWGEKGENGNIKKVNLIGHSFGGVTIRLLAALMTSGDADEIKATPENELSPLFKGGKEDWIFSLTCIAAPHNGSSVLYALGDLLTGSLTKVVYAAIALVANTNLNDVVDMQLGQFGFKPGEGLIDLSPRKIIELSETKDNCFYDLTPHGSIEINNKIKISKNIYYYSIPVVGTKQNSLKTFDLPIKEMNPILWLPAALMGTYKGTEKHGVKVDKSWQPNDGLVSLVSSRAPFGDPQIYYESGIGSVKGIWQIMPTVTGDHGTVIGLFANEDELKNLFTGIINRVNTI